MDQPPPLLRELCGLRHRLNGTGFIVDEHERQQTRLALRQSPIQRFEINQPRREDRDRLKTSPATEHGVMLNRRNQNRQVLVGG